MNHPAAQKEGHTHTHSYFCRTDLQPERAGCKDSKRSKGVDNSSTCSLPQQPLITSDPAQEEVAVYGKNALPIKSNRCLSVAVCKPAND